MEWKKKTEDERETSKYSYIQKQVNFHKANIFQVGYNNVVNGGGQRSLNLWRNKYMSSVLFHSIQINWWSDYFH